MQARSRTELTAVLSKSTEENRVKDLDLPARGIPLQPFAGLLPGVGGNGGEQQPFGGLLARRRLGSRPPQSCRPRLAVALRRCQLAAR
jgi:hypothetical protein